MRHGKGILYYNDGEIKYDGDFFNDKYEGNGKYIYKNGDYYIGQFKNDLKHGNGIEYRRDGKVKYTGFWTEGKFEAI